MQSIQPSYLVVLNSACRSRLHTSRNRLWIHIESFNKGVQMTSSSLTVVKFRFVLRTTVRFAVLMVINLNTVHLQVLFGKWTKSLFQTIEMFAKFTNVSVWNYSGSYFFFILKSWLAYIIYSRLSYIIFWSKWEFASNVGSSIKLISEINIPSLDLKHFDIFIGPIKKGVGR